MLESFRLEAYFIGDMGKITIETRYDHIKNAVMKNTCYKLISLTDKLRMSPVNISWFSRRE